eukprot:3141792-Rhodomonas_salina.1
MEPWSSRCSSSYVLDGNMELSLQREHCSLLAEERTCLPSSSAVGCRGEEGWNLNRGEGADQWGEAAAASVMGRVTDFKLWQRQCLLGSLSQGARPKLKSQ